MTIHRLIGTSARHAINWPHLHRKSNVPARDRYPNKPPLPNADPDRVTAHFIPKPVRGAPSLFELSANQKYEPDPAQRDKLVARLTQDGFTVTEVSADYVTATGSKKLFREVLRLRLDPSEVKRVNGLRYDHEPRPFTGPHRPRRRAWRAFESRGLSAVVFPPIVQLAVDAPPAGTKSGGNPLALPDGFRDALGLNRIHASGKRGQGVRVVQLDSGRHAHPFFGNFDAATLGHADPDPDWGHGTAMAGLFKTVAPDAHLITRSIYAPNASIFDLFTRALRDDNPDVIFVPLCIGVVDQVGESPAAQVKLDLFEKRVRAAERAGVLVLIAAGNRGIIRADRPADASHPSVVSVGGCRLAPPAPPQRSVGTNRFLSQLYAIDANSTVNEVAGPCGHGAHDPHLTLPIPHPAVSCFHGEVRGGAATEPVVHTWGGSSAATAFAAGVASLLKGAFPDDTLPQLRAKLRALIPDPPATPAAPAPPWPNWAAPTVGW